MTDVSGGDDESGAVTSNGTAWMWGRNEYGQLGNGSTTGTSVPTQVVGLGFVTDLDIGTATAHAVTSDGVVWGWGFNGQGEVGDGTQVNRAMPVSVLSGATAVVAGSSHTLALRADGTVWAWGNNSHGQLAQLPAVLRLTSPQQVAGLSNAVAIGAGGNSSFAVLSDGSLWAWGDNANGELGNGTTQSWPFPARVSGIEGVTAVSAGADYALALTTGGSVSAWGDNNVGQLGDGTTTDRLTPVQVTGLSNVMSVSAGKWHSLAVDGNGAGWGWGSNAFGHLGDGTHLARNSPVRVQVPICADRTFGSANGQSRAPSLSANGQFVAFDSAASNLVPGDGNGAGDVFVIDAGSDSIMLASASSGGNSGNGASTEASISGDGRYVVFASTASNLVSGDTNGVSDIFLRDLVNGTTTRLSVSSSGGQASGRSIQPSISSDGRYVAFASYATNLVTGDKNGVADIFVRDTAAGTTTLASLTSNGKQSSGGDSQNPSISDGGRYVAFDSTATNLVMDRNRNKDIFVRDRVANSTIRASVSSSGAEANGASAAPAISSDGRYVAFESTAINLVSAGDANGSTSDVFRRDLSQGVTQIASYGGNGGTREAAIAGAGSLVVFTSSANNWFTNDTNSTDDVYGVEFGPTSTTLTRLSFDDWTGEGNGASTQPAVSSDGSVIGFSSVASDLVEGDTNGLADVFVHRSTRTRRCALVLITLAQLLAIAKLAFDPSLGDPYAGQLVYRVWGGDYTTQFGNSWTPANPRIYGPDRYREVAGLPDRLNAGTKLTFGYLDNPGSAVPRPSEAVSPWDDYGIPAFQNSGVAYRSYGGGLLGYVIVDAQLHVLNPQTIDLSPPYGGPPTGCTPAPRGCVGEGLS